MLNIDHLIVRLKRRNGRALPFTDLWMGMPRGTDRTALVKALQAHPNVEQASATRFKYRATTK